MPEDSVTVEATIFPSSVYPKIEAIGWEDSLRIAFASQQDSLRIA